MGNGVGEGFRLSPRAPEPMDLLMSCLPTRFPCTHAHPHTHTASGGTCLSFLSGAALTWPHWPPGAVASSQQQEVVGPGEWVEKGSRLMLQSWRFAVVWLTLPDLGPFLQALFLLPGTIPGLDVKHPEFSVPGRGNREKVCLCRLAHLGRWLEKMGSEGR